MHSGWRSSVPTECFDSLSKHSLKVLTIAHNAVAESNRRRTEALSTLPGRDELRATFLATLQAVPQNFLRLLNAAPQNFVYLLSAREDALGGEGGGAK